MFQVYVGKFLEHPKQMAQYNQGRSPKILRSVCQSRPEALHHRFDEVHTMRFGTFFWGGLDHYTLPKFTVEPENGSLE